MDVNPGGPSYSDVLRLMEESLLKLEVLHLDLTSILAMLRVVPQPVPDDPPATSEPGPYL